MQDDLYSGYDDESNPLFETSYSRPTEPPRARTPATRGGTALRDSRLGTGMGRTALATARGSTAEEGARPVTAVRGAGYVSTNNSSGRKQETAGTFTRQKEPSASEQITALEVEVHETLESAVHFLKTGDPSAAREAAQKAQEMTNELQARSEALGMQDSVNLDLQFAVRVCEAHCTQAAGMDQEALAMYSSLAKNQEFLMGGRIRVNMGNMFAKRGQWTDAIKQYRMALDQIPSERQGFGPHAHLQCRLLRNIGVAFLQQGIYSDARDNFDAVLRIRPDMVSAYNKLIATYMITKSVEQSDALKQAFQDVLCVPGLAQAGVEKSEGDITGAAESEVDFNSQMAQSVVAAAKLIAPRLHPTDPGSGFEWCLEELFKAKLVRIAHDVMMAKAHYFLRSADMDEAASVLKQFERQGGSVRIKAATNLSFLYSLEGNSTDASRYSDLVMAHDEYHVQALVNAGNCKLEQGLASEATREEDLTAAWNLYEAALKQEPDCVEAIYNMSLAAKAMKQYDLALEQLFVLNGLIPNQVEVLYQIADIYMLTGNHKKAKKMLHMTYDFVGSEPGLMARLGNISATMGNRDESLQCMLDSQEQCPNIDTLAMICTQYTNDEKYATAARYFMQAAMLQPSEPKWMLMVASCHRRAQKYEQAMSVYEQVHEQHPENREALKFLIQLAVELQDETKRMKYESALTKVEKVMSMQEHVPRPTSKQLGGESSSKSPMQGIPPGGQHSLAGDDDLLPDPATMQRLSSKVSQIEPVSAAEDMIGVGLLPGLD